ncbi:hypothetical protein [Salipaludibacillus agaradhaerens]|uniref:hypothetical protein n=1 Tax=Salipaludibacillus agaradhaerens TaxID=76935 RepID=UPI0009971472|nr:hypothetical protein [Salipaludibacillus agaradhaerens]
MSVVKREEERHSGVWSVVSGVKKEEERHSGVWSVVSVVKREEERHSEVRSVVSVAKKGKRVPLRGEKRSECREKRASVPRRREIGGKTKTRVNMAHSSYKTGAIKFRQHL